MYADIESIAKLTEIIKRRECTTATQVHEPCSVYYYNNIIILYKI